jgi:uncharacterized protein YrrD
MTSPPVDVFRLPVYTTSGEYLGRVVGIEVDITGRVVMAYQVAASIPIERLWHKRLIISADQIVSLSDKAMVVEGSIGQSATNQEKNTRLAAEPT